MLYFIMLIIFLVLVVGPVIVRQYINSLPSIPLQLMQPTGQDNNDTSNSQTGTALIGGGGAAAATTAASNPFAASGFGKL